MARLRFWALWGCVFALGTPANAAEPPQREQFVLPVYNLDKNGEQDRQPKWILDTRSNAEVQPDRITGIANRPNGWVPRMADKPSDYEPNRHIIPAENVTSSDVRELASWARRRLAAGSRNGPISFTAEDIRAAESWARDYDRRKNAITPIQHTVPPAPRNGPANSQPGRLPARITDEYDPDCACPELLSRNNPCVSCEEDCCATIFAGADLLLLYPLDEPSQRVRLTDLVTGTSRSGSSHPGLGGGIRIYLGIENNHCGIRVRYTRFGAEHVHNDPHVPQTPRFAFNETYDLKFETVDFELFKRFCFCDWILESSFGARYANMYRNATVLGYGTLGNGVDVSGFAVGAFELEGTGFTASLGGIKSIWCDCGWSFFWNLRASYLWSDTVATGITEANALTNQPGAFGSTHARNVATASNDRDTTFIGEIQLGLQYERCLDCIPATFLFRFGLEYQHWEVGDPRAATNSFAFLQGGNPVFGGRSDARSRASDGNLDLIGLTFGAGLRY